jgi:hypothetical protein
MSGCVVLLIDESAAMQSPVAKVPGAPMTALGAPTKSKAESVATAVNSLLNRLAQEPDCEVALVGYRTSAAGDVEVGCRWGGALAGRDFVPAAELKGSPVTVEKRVRRIPGPGGMLQEQPFDFPVWYQPQLGDKAPHLAAFGCCQQLLAAWASRPGASGAPLVINLFAGSSADGNPSKATQEVLALQTPGGSPLVLQVHLGSSDTVPPTVYPSNRAYLTVGPMRDLFDRVSVLPDPLVAALKAAKVPIVPKARGMVYNAKMEEVTRALSLIQAHLKPVAVAAVPKPVMPPRPGGPVTPPRPTPAVVAPQPVAAPAAPAAPAVAAVTAPAVPEAAPPVEAFAPPPADAFAAPPTDAFAPPTTEAFTPEPAPPLTVPEAVEPPPMELPAAAAPEPALGPITPDQPALVLFVLDRSVDDPFSGNLKNACARLQGRLGDLVEQIVKFGGGAIDVGVVSYGLNGMGEVEVRSALEGGLAPRSLARDSELEAGAVRVEDFAEEIPNGVGGLITINHRRPVLVEVEPTYGAAATPAFTQASQMVASWCSDHPATKMPPVVIHLTRGKLDPADAENAAAQLQSVVAFTGVVQAGQLQSVSPAAGPNVVLYHVVETEADSPTVVCPDSETQLADPSLQVLWRLSSPLLARAELAADKPTITEQSRGLVVNGKPNLLLDALRRARQ